MAQDSILLAAMSLDYGGAETHVIDLAMRLSDIGYDVTVASAGGRLVPRLEAARIPHFSVPLNSRSPLKILTAIAMMTGLIRAHGFSLLHAHGRIPAWVLSRLQREDPPPLVTTYHGVYAAGFPWNLVTRQGDMAIAVSEDIKSHFVNKLGFDPERITVIPNGIDTVRFAPGPCPPLRRSLLGASEAPLVVNVSRLDEFADTALELVRALPRLEQRFPGITAVIVGDGNRMADVESACREMNLMLGRKAAIAVGGQQDVVPYLLSADVVVAVARAALEAMACGKPVVFAGEGGLRGAFSAAMLPDLRRHNFTARGSGNEIRAEGLAEAIASFIENPRAAQEAAGLGRRVVESEYSWDVLLPRIIAVYDKARAISAMRKKHKQFK